MTEKNVNQKNKLDQILEGLTRRKAATVACAQQFFVWIEAPSHAKGLGKVCTNLLSILPKVQEIANNNPHQFKSLIANLPGWKVITQDLAGVPEKGKTSLVGDYTGSNALYTALWYVPTKPQLAEKHSTLMAVLCVAVAKLQIMVNRGENYSYSHYHAALFARKLTKVSNEQELLSLPSEARSLEEYLQALDKHSPGLGGLWKFLDYAVREKAGIRRTSSARAKTASVLSEDLSELDDEAEVIVVQKVQLPQSREKKRFIRETLTSPVEFSEGRETASITTDGPKTAGEDVIYARKVGKMLTIQNQLLPFRWYMLSKYEVASFLDGVQDLCQTPKIETVPGLELAAFLSVLFWLSARPESVCNFKLYCDPLKGASGNGYIEAWGEPPRPHWVVIPPQPKGYENPPRRLFKAYDAERILYLPVPEPAQEILLRYLAFSGHRVEKMFGRDKAVYLHALNAFYATFRKNRIRLTSAMLSDYVFWKIMYAPGADIVTAMLATGRAHFLGFVSLHYTSVGVTALQKRYEDVSNSIMQGEDSNNSHGRHAVLRSRDFVGRLVSTRTGSRYCPEMETVTNLVEKLQKGIECGRTVDHADIDGLFEIHDLMVVYTTLMIGFATGYRSVIDPFLDEAVIDPISGFAMISDKDNDSFSHSRLIWVPEMVLKQLDHYRQHLKVLARLLLVANRTLHYKIRKSLDEPHSNPVLFFVSKQLKSIPVGKKILEDYYEYRLNCTIPSNANRHYLRTNLLESGCPVDAIDAFMGHWGHGTSAWGRFSSVSPARYKESLETHLLPILKKDGWRVISGLGAGHE